MKVRNVVLYLHPLSYHCYILVKALDREGLLSSIRVRRTDVEDVISVVKLGVVTVPWVMADGKAMLVGPFDSAELISFLGGNLGNPIPFEQAVDNFVRSVASSSYAASLVVIHKSFRPVLDVEFVAGGSKARYHGVEGYVPLIIDELGRSSEALLQYYDLLLESVALHLVRDFWISGVDARSIGEKDVKLWLLARACTDLVGAPYPLDGIGKASSELIKYVRSRADELTGRVEAEMSTVMSDTGYLKSLAVITQ